MEVSLLQDPGWTDSPAAGHPKPAPTRGGCHLYQGSRHVCAWWERKSSLVACLGKQPGRHCINSGKTHLALVSLLFIFLAAKGFISKSKLNAWREQTGPILLIFGGLFFTRNSSLLQESYKCCSLHNQISGSHFNRNIYSTYILLSGFLIWMEWGSA